MIVMKKVKFYVAIINRGEDCIDKYYRTDKDRAVSLANSNKIMFPKATVTIDEEEVNIDDK